jgi:signal transduction histidine kinase
LAVAALGWAVVSDVLHTSAQREAAVRWELHSVEVQLQTQLLLAAVEAAETGQRGYLLSGEAVYLEPHNRGAEVAQAHMDELQLLTADNSSQRVRLVEVERLMRERLRRLSEVLELAESGSRGRAIARLQVGQGRQVMDALRNELDRVWQEETRLRAVRRAASEAAVEAQRRSAVLLVVFALLLLAGLAWAALAAARAAGAARRQAQQAEVARSVQAELEERIAEALANQRKSEAALRQSQKMEAVGQLAGGIAHDFNNMLAIVIGSLEMAQRRLSAGEKNIDRFLANAMDGARRAASLTQRILAFSRQQPLEPKVTDINRLVSNMSELLHRTLGEQTKLETVLASGLWKAKIDAPQLENLILNLAVNARDAMPEGGALTIETANAYIDEAYAAQHAEAAPGQYVCVAVTDTGIGMAPDVMAKAFEPFFTTKGVGKGTGLGLSQAFGFVKQSRGHMKIYSELGQGTSMKVYLPRWSGEDALTATSLGPGLRPGEALRGSPDEIILVVEDDARVRVISVEALRELGYTAQHAGSGVEALEMLEANAGVKLLFTDIVMPDMNGRQLAAAALERWPALKILYTTGYTRNAIVHNGVLDADVAFIAKPFSLEQLALKVRSVLDA